MNTIYSTCTVSFAVRSSLPTFDEDVDLSYHFKLEQTRRSIKSAKELIWVQAVVDGITQTVEGVLYRN